MTPDNSTVGGVLKSIGIGSMGLEKIKFGAGVVGKMTTSLIAFLSVLGIISLSGVICGQLTLTYICIPIIVFVFVFNHISIMIFASRHPAPAMLEGTELVRYHQVEMAARGCRHQHRSQT